MYVPAKFALEDDAAWGIVRDAGAGMLVRAAGSQLISVFVPVVVDEDRTTVRAHVARGNPWWRSVEDESDVLGLFVSASAYVSPSYYPSRIEDPGVVPTWNYVAVEVRGRLHIHDDTEWLDDQVRDLTSMFETGRAPQWHVDDAPPEFIERQLKAIVGVTIDVVSIEGKAKLSQNRPAIDHDSVREHLGDGTLNERNVAARMRDE
jgi:transcriptional regulator